MELLNLTATPQLPASAVSQLVLGPSPSLAQQVLKFLHMVHTEEAYGKAVIKSAPSAASQEAGFKP